MGHNLHQKAQNKSINGQILRQKDCIYSKF